jgi:tRNA dimethylallyltransferase
MKGKESKNILIVLAGSTAVGKTSVAIALAKHFDCEIFSSDSRQIYKELNIGTAKPNMSELAEVEHHFIGNVSITENYNVRKYERQLISRFEEYFKKKRIGILCGGTGFYIKAALYGMDDIPDIPSSVAQEIEKEIASKGLEKVGQELLLLDPDIGNQINLRNPRRVTRALSILRHTGLPFSHFRKGTKVQRNFTPVKILLERDREKLYTRINERVDKMLDSGLLEEVQSLKDYFHLPSLNTVGYREIIAYLNKEIEFSEAIRLIKRNSRRYAKRQITWFKNQDNFMAFHPEKIQNIRNYIEDEINRLQ